MDHLDKIRNAESMGSNPKIEVTGAFLVEIVSIKEQDPRTGNAKEGDKNWPIEFKILESSHPDIRKDEIYVRVEKSYLDYGQGFKNFNQLIAALYGFYSSNAKMLEENIRDQEYLDVLTDKMEGVLVRLVTEAGCRGKSGREFVKHTWTPYAPGSRLPRKDGSTGTVPLPAKKWKKHPQDDRYAYCGSEVKLIEQLSEEERKGL